MTASYNYVSNYLETINGFILRHKLFKHIRNQKNISRNDELTPIFTNDIDILKTKLILYIEFSFQILQLILVIIILLFVNPRIILFAIILIILMPLIPLYISKWLPNVALQVQNKKANFTTYLIESIRLSKEVRLNLAEDRDYLIFSRKLGATLKPIIKLHYLNSYFYLNNIIYSIFTFITLLIGVIDVVNNTLSVGELVAIITYLSYISNPINTLLSYYNQLKVIRGSQLRYESVFNNEVINDSPSKNVKFKDDYNILTIRNYYNEIVNNNMKLNLDINRGEWLLIYGHSGAGKSTLLDSIAKLNENYAGTIRYKGVNVNSVPNSLLYNDIFYIYQGYDFFEGSFINNTLSQIKNISLFNDIVVDLGIEYLLENNDIYIERGHRELSGGEKQRLILALALYKDPELLLLDEPTSALDDYNTQILIKVLYKYRMDRTTIIVSHNEIFKCIEKGWKLRYEVYFNTFSNINTG